jgi:hypothetical protein
MTNDMTDIDVIDQVLYKGKCRVDKKMAQSFLIKNKSWVVGGKVRYFKIQHIGLSICEISLAEQDAEKTYFVDKCYEKHKEPKLYTGPK